MVMIGPVVVVMIGAIVVVMIEAVVVVMTGTGAVPNLAILLAPKPETQMLLSGPRAMPRGPNGS